MSFSNTNRSPSKVPISSQAPNMNGLRSQKLPSNQVPLKSVTLPYNTAPHQKPLAQPNQPSPQCISHQSSLDPPNRTLPNQPPQQPSSQQTNRQAPPNQYLSPPPPSQVNKFQTILYQPTAQPQAPQPVLFTSMKLKQSIHQMVAPVNYSPQIQKSTLSLSGIHQNPAFVRLIPSQNLVHQYVAPPPQPHPVIQYIVEKPIQVVDLSQYEKLWRDKMEDLENQLKAKPRDPSDDFQSSPHEAELNQLIENLQGKLKDQDDQLENMQSQLKDKDDELEKLKQQLDILKNQLESERAGNDYYQQQVQDKQNQIDQLKSQRGQSGVETQKQIDQLTQELKNQKAQNKTLQQDLQSTGQSLERYRQENDELRAEKQYWKDQADEKDLQIQDMAQEIQNLSQELQEMREQMEEHSETTTHYLTNEVNTWKNKFMELNNKFHQVQEDFMLCEAELEHMKKQKSQQYVTVTSSEVKRSTGLGSSIVTQGDLKDPRKSSEVRQGSEYERSALNENDLDKLKRLQYN